ncbi:HalOD1 output domain-containing protein [Halorussus sp. AFM4]|uniref:HalOD1 output domain-containing protein n=1 Tax=Halorussus sp. AFM4 TaxID=3421651 RepID=UPI003EB9770F
MTDEHDITEVGEREAHVHHRSIFENDDADPSTELVTVVAELKGVAQEELDPLYSWADSLVQDLYSSPPPAEAQAVVEFSYEGYRVTLYQDGHAVFTARSTSS